jgi:hypothetical protein
MSLIPLMLCNTTAGVLETQRIASRQDAVRSSNDVAKSQRVGQLKDGQVSILKSVCPVVKRKAFR